MGCPISKEESERPKPEPLTDTLNSSNTAKEPTMPLFGGQSTEAKKKLQHKLYLARESPEPTFDISGCEISEVPNGVYSLCKVLQKEALLMHDNWLTSLKGGGGMVDLVGLRVLDLHNNRLTHLPEEIFHLKNLQVLNIEKNKLKDLPESIGKLHSLQTLNARSNHVKCLPQSVCEMQSLRTLDLGDNSITALPRSLCRVQTLETVILDGNTMRYPASEICSSGTEAIMKYLCSECGIEYIPPSNFVLDVLDTPSPAELTMHNTQMRALQTNDDMLMENLQLYENIKEQKRKQRVALERQLEEEQRMQAELSAQAMQTKRHLVEALAEDQNRMDGELSKLQKSKEIERKKLVDTLYEVEQSASQLITQLLAMNEKARKMEELAEQMEKERIILEEWFTIRQEDMENLRKRDVLVNMKRVMEECEGFEALRLAYEKSKAQVIDKAMQNARDTDRSVDDVLMMKQSEQNFFIEELMKQEKLQKEAFEALQLSKDAKHKRITGQIDLIENELSQLTMVEVERREIRLDTEKNILEEKRQALTKLLVQLMKEKDIREEELKSRLLEMEQNRLDNQTDYWLVQYQRLMDRKPQNLIDQETKLEYAVSDILQQANAADYISLFARHRITIETMCTLTDDDLKQMGVHELGLRKAILKGIVDYKAIQSKADKKEKELKEGKQEPAEPDDAAAAAPPESKVEPQAAPEEVFARINTECVVCMENNSNIIFLNCGHVCCCDSCAGPLSQCPLCRQDIIQRIRLNAQVSYL